MGDGTLEERVVALAKDQVGVITRSGAEAAGVSASTLHRRAKEGLLRVKELPGVYVVPTLEVKWFTDVSAAAIATEGAAMGSTGAALWKLDGFDEYRGLIDVVTNKDRRIKAPDTRITLATWLNPAVHFTRRQNIPVLQLEYLLCSLGETASIDEVEGAMDHVLRMKWSTWDKLEAAAKETRKRFRIGAPMLLEAIARRSPQRQRTDSLLETKCVQVLRIPELPTPTLQYEVFDGSKRLGAADIAFPEHNVLIETIGKEAHRSELWQLTTDCRRTNGMAVLDRYIILGFSWTQVTKEPAEVISTVMRAMKIARQTEWVLKERPGGSPTLQMPAAL